MAVSVFDPGNVFVTLSTTPFKETAPLARALQSVAIEPAGFNQLNRVQDLTLTGYTSDIPGIQARPFELALDNFLILSSLTAQLEQRLTETRTSLLQVRETLADAIRNENPNLRNRADDILNSSLLAQLIAATDQTGVLEDKDDDPVAVPKFLDYTYRPTESAVFGTTLSGATRTAALSSYFVSGVALSAGDEITLDRLLIGNQGAGDGFLVSIRNELFDDATARLLRADDSEVANGEFITAAELSTVRLVAGSGGLGALDYLSIVEVNEDGGGGYDERGGYRTVAVTSNADIGVRSEGDNGEEPIREFYFHTESGVAYSQIRLQFDGVDTGTYADILAAIEAGAVRVKVGETLIDGQSINPGQVDRRNSNGDELVIVFPFQAAEDGLAQNGLEVEVRSLDGSNDISGITVKATFP